MYVQTSSLENAYGRARREDLVEPLWKTPWEQRQFTVVDPDGHLMTFFAPLASAASDEAS